MRTKQVVAVSTLLIVCIAVLVLLFLFIQNNYSPFWKKQAPRKIPVAGERAPKKIPLELVKELMSQQRESSYNLRQLAQGGIKRIVINGATRQAREVDIAITTTYVDDSTLDGTATFWQRNGDWYLVEVTREFRLPDPPLETRVSELSGGDIDIGRKIVEQQQENQDVTIDFIQGKIKSLVVSKVSSEIDTAGRDESIAHITTTYEDGKTADISAELVNNEGFWYLVKIKRK